MMSTSSGEKEIVRKDLIYEGITTQPFEPILRCPRTLERTWFTKGLRPSVSYKLIFISFSVRKDLIYEGITTIFTFLDQNESPSVRKDLIYEGITTSETLRHLFASRSLERTWFTKGLRRITLSSWISSGEVRKDLIYEGITTVK